MTQQVITPNGLATYHSSDFRTFEPEIVKNRNGNFVQIMVCEELVEGRWEAYISTSNVEQFAKAV